MRNTPNVKAERYRVRVPGTPSDEVTGNCGMFQIPIGSHVLKCIVSDGGGWDHVSVSLATAKRCPTWDEMCAIKDLFFRDDEWATQYHPAKASYVNDHPFVLHLWRPQSEAERKALTYEHGELYPLAPTPGPLPVPPVEFV